MKNFLSLFLFISLIGCPGKEASSPIHPLNTQKNIEAPVNTFSSVSSASSPDPQHHCDPKPFLQKHENGKDHARVFKEEETFMKSLGKNAWVEKPLPAHTYRFMTWNVFSGRNVEKQLNLQKQLETITRQLRPDVLAIQEDTHLFKSLQQEGYTVFHANTFGNFGNTLAIKKDARIHIKASSLSSLLLSETQERRIAVFHEVTIGNLQLLLVTAHLDVFDNTGQTRLQELQRLHHYIQTHIAPHTNVIFMGDFNALDEKQIDQLDKLYSTLHLKRTIQAIDQRRHVPTLFIETAFIRDTMGMTEIFDFPSLIPPWNTCTYGRRVDYMFLRGNEIKAALSKEAIHVYYTSESDHFAIVADFVIPPN